MDELQRDLKQAEEWLTRELSSIRTGRANPALLDSITVDSYGTRVPLNQVASVQIEDARTLRVNPWDTSQGKSIEKAIQERDLGLALSLSDSGLRVIFPEVTGEQKERFVKLAKDKFEEARIRVRKAREETIKNLEAEEKDGAASKDDTFRAKETVQKHVDTCNETLENIFNKKAADIRGE